MKYRCYKCGNKLEENESSCSRCGSPRIKVAPKSNDNEEVNTKRRPNYIIPVIFVLNVVFMILAIYNFKNSDLLYTFGGIAIFVVAVGIVLFPKNSLLKCLLTAELLVIFGLILLPFIILYILFKEVVSGWL